MTKLRKQSFLKGALILAIANLVVKAIGALYKIPLTNLLGPDGIGIYNAGYTIYNVLFVVATAGLPVAISKLVSENIAKNNYAEARHVFFVSRRLLLVVGIIGAAVLFFGSGFFARRINMEVSTMSIMALAPCMFFVSLMSSYRGLFQGMSNMVPTASSEVIESVCKLVMGLVLAYILMPSGKPFAAAGAILGVSTGGFLAAMFLVGYYGKIRSALKEKVSQSEGVKSSSSATLKRLLKLAVPITIGSAVFTLASVIDLTMILNQLAGLGFDENTRTTMYGYYSGHAVTLFNMPLTVITSLSVSIMPTLSAALAQKKKSLAKTTVETAIRITLLFGLPCAVGMSVLSGPILKFLFNDTNAAGMLSVLSFGIIFVSIVMVSNSVLQADGKVWIPVINMLIGGAVKVIVNFILVGNINININGAPYGTVLCYITTAGLNLYAIHKSIRPGYGFMFIVKSALSAAVMGVLAYLVCGFVVPMLGNTLGLIAGIGVGVLSYFALLILLRALKKEDVMAMPGSKYILKLIGRFL
ncbi:MAG: polysaccharide biosynthesis protein [Clostridia bacterium]|nr:polysaccharide biosynthesis protein [Clostridia bacterium]